MAYIGARPLIGNYQICDAITASATADYTLQVGSVNVVPESANAMIVSLNSVIQGPGASRGFTVSGSTISFNSALTSSDVIDFIYIFGDVLDIGTPTDGTVTAAKLAADAVITAKILDSNVTTAKIADNNVTLAKLGDGTQGDVLYYGASGAPARLGFGTSGYFLKTQGTGANPAWAEAGGGAYNLLSTTTATTAASLEITANINSTYRMYCIMLSNFVNATDNKILYLNVSQDGGSTWLQSSGYRYIAQSRTDQNAPDYPYSKAANDAQIGGTPQNIATSLCAVMYIDNPSETSYAKNIYGTSAFHNNANDLQLNQFACQYKTNTAAIDAIKFYYSSSNITTGTAKLYGIS